MNKQKVLGGRERERRERKWGHSEKYYILGGGGTRKYISGLEGSQAVPTRPSGKGNACDRNYFYDVGRAAL
jgi:hypothetical protein